MNLHSTNFSFLRKPVYLLVLGLFLCLFVVFCNYNTIVNFFEKPSEKEIQYLDSLVHQARDLSRLDPQKTLELGLVVLAKSEELNYQKGLADSYRLLSFSSWHSKNLVLTNEYLEKAKSIYQELNFDSGLADLEVSYGGISLDLGDTLGALDNYQRAYAIFKRLGQKDRLRVAAFNIAMAYSGINQLDSAKFYLNQSESLKQSDEEIPGFGVIHTLKGKIAYNQKKFDVAKTYFQESLEYFVDHPGGESFVVFFESSLFLGKILNLQGEPDQAIKLLEASIHKESIFASEFFSRLIFLDLIKLYESQEEFEKANKVFWLKEEFEIELERRRVRQVEVFSAELSLYRGFQIENEQLNSRISTITKIIILVAAISSLLLFLFLRLIYLNRKYSELRTLLEKSFQIAEIGTFEVKVDQNQEIRLVSLSDIISNLMGFKAGNPDFSVFSVNQFLDTNQQHKLNSLILQFSGNEEFFKEEFEIKNLKSERKVIRMISKVIPFQHGGFTLKGILLDITNESLMLEQMRENFEKEKSLKELREQLLHLTSHEIRTPLSNISSSVELISLLYTKISPEDLQFRFKTIIDNAKANIAKLVEMLDGLLLYERVQSGELELKIESIDLEPFLEAIISEVKEANSSDENILLMVPEQGAWIKSDRSLLHHIFTNLVSNAIKYSDKNLPIEFEVLPQEGEILVRIKDYGIGIPQTDLARLFTPFKRGTNVSGISGSGLGLSIVKRMVERIGGEVTVTSEEGKFTEFKVILREI